MNKVVNLQDYRKKKVERFSKDIEPIECDSFEEFQNIIKTYFEEDSEEYQRLMNCYEATKNRLTFFYKDAINSLINNPNQLSSLIEETDSDYFCLQDSDMTSELICEREACSIVLEILWNLNKEEEK